MPRLILYAGPNGAGKSTLRDVGNDQIDVVIDADRIAKTLGGPQNEVAAGRAAITLFQASIAQAKSISLETTLSGNTILQRIANAKRAGYEVEIRFVALATPKLHINRVAQRVRNGGHHISPETVMRRYWQSLKNLPAAISLADHVKIFDNSEQTSRILFRSEGRLILQLDHNPPAWFQTVLPAIRAALTG
jgi:predicted ABC-type ATPase